MGSCHHVRLNTIEMQARSNPKQGRGIYAASISAHQKVQADFDTLELLHIEAG